MKFSHMKNGNGCDVQVVIIVLSIYNTQIVLELVFKSLFTYCHISFSFHMHVIYE